MPDQIPSSSGRLVCRLLPADVQDLLDALELSADNAARLERLVNTLLAQAERLTVRCEQYRREIELANVEAARLQESLDAWRQRAEGGAGDALLVAVLRPRAARREAQNHEFRVLLAACYRALYDAGEAMHPGTPDGERVDAGVKALCLASKVQPVAFGEV